SSTTPYLRAVPGASLPADSLCFYRFFFTDPPPPDISTLSLHDALPTFILELHDDVWRRAGFAARTPGPLPPGHSDEASIALIGEDRKSTRLNSSHQIISYAVFCLKKKNEEHPGTMAEPT